MAQETDQNKKEGKRFSPEESFRKDAHLKSMKEYEAEYDSSVENPDSYWKSKAEQLHWFSKKEGSIFSWDQKECISRWFDGWTTNACYNCLDRHLENSADKKALIWQGEPEEEKKSYSYGELHSEVCRFANVLKSNGIKKGDRIAVYLPMIPELMITMLACARIGAVHSVIFAAFSPVALRNRIEDSEARILVTADGYYRKGKIIDQKKNADEAVSTGCSSISRVIIVKRAGNASAMKPRDLWWHEEMAKAEQECPAEDMDGEDPLFILYTSGTTGKPKGVMHSTAGYLLYVYQTFRWVFDIREDDIYWCTADCGWITGHSYIVYGPLSNCATTVMFEGVPTQPEPDRFWKIVEDFKISIFYTAPTVIRSLAALGPEWPKKHDLNSLRLLGSVGEPINPEAWMWYHKNIGRGKCPIVDTWWQTETGGIMITPIPGAMTLKPGSALKPFPGIVPAILREDGTEAEPGESGYLVIKKPWPGMLRDVFKDHQRFKETYYSKYPGIYLTGDGAKKDDEGDFWITGRIDDVINVSGHRIGTSEIESALVSHAIVAEAAVVPFHHKIKGNAIYAFVTLNVGVEKTEELKKELIALVEKEISKIARPDKIQFADSLPKTRSGKIMRRVLRNIAEGSENLGDLTTLAEPSVVDSLVKERV